MPASKLGLQSPSALAALVLPVLGRLRRETVMVVVLDPGMRPSGLRVLTIGSADQAIMPVRETLVAVLRADGYGFALAHNHPSGDPSPSVEDIEATRQVAAGADVVGLRFLDHLIVADVRWLSLREAGYIP